ncbi:sensor histidine kinase [Reyranella aquatilis]|uniref:histidine kinase n=1 Tax=Reyranella aquatilis TaxID=2035356 RepID=A0ABS8L0C7_9HYPH|nr:sensor histidine kinase [Reyranella aquatilis]MCC8431773.1 sensor histidine kinase [Reyranella aquatilis]
MARWSLRSKLVTLVALALLPVLGLAAWQAEKEEAAGIDRRAAALGAVADMSVARYSGLFEASQRMLAAACADESIERAASGEAAAAGRCDGYLTRILAAYPDQYSTALVTDDQGVARCATAPTAIGMSFGDRDVFQKVRSAKGFVAGDTIVGRVASRAIVPIALPVMRDGAFRGMCVVGITLKALAETAAQVGGPSGIGVAVVDRSGAAIGGDPQSMRRLPVPARLAEVLIGGRVAFSDVGQDASFYEFRVRPVGGSALFVVVSAPSKEGAVPLSAAWANFLLIVLAAIVVLLVIWFGADRWCVQPLRYIQDFADKVARGENIVLSPSRPWSPEMASVAAGVSAMAEAIASREAALRANVEQRDHMLREIHHRVKNNLQMISSLLNLQAGEIRSPRIRRFFGDAQNRVLTLSILHRHLYERSSWSLVDFQQFISDLVRQISVGRIPQGRQAPRYHIRAPIMAVGPDTAIPIGLIVTEAVSIALSHDFSRTPMPEIRIETSEHGEEVQLVIEDNGVARDIGMPVPEGRGGFALTLIRGLAMQLGGEVSIERKPDGGNRVVVTFPTPAADDPANA